MKKLLKITALMLVLVLAIGVLAACNDEPAPTPDNGDPNPTPHTHTYGEWTTTKEATCAELGTSVRSCTCGVTETVSIPLKDEHSYGDPVITKEPNCTEEGIITSTCTVCGHTEEETIPVKHNFPVVNWGELSECTICGAKQTP